MYPLVVKLMAIAAGLVCVSACFGQYIGPQDFDENWEFGGTIGYGIYHNGTVYAPGAEAQAGIRNRFAAGVVIGEDLYEYVSGEIRYLYQDGHPFIRYNGVTTDIQGQSHAITYDLLFHFAKHEKRLRPFVSGGLGLKGYVIAGPAPYPQPIPTIVTLNATNEWKFVMSPGGGVKYRLLPHMLLRADLRDYITTFPKSQIMPATHNTARGIFEQFTPMFGLSYVW